MKIFREELFGGVLFDTNILKYSLVGKNEMLPYDKFIPLPSLATRSDILSAPIRVYFEITKQCNLTCKHCFVSASNDSLNIMSTKSVFELIDQMQKFRILDIRFTGGEPTIREDWYKILMYAKQKEFTISINTNGVYENNQNIIKKFLDIKPNQITISIDGLKSSHEQNRGKSTFSKTLNSLKEMSKAKLPLRVNTVITKKNFKDIPQLIKLVANYIEEINFFYMRPIGRAINNMGSSLTFEEHYQSAIDTIALRKKYPHLRIMHFEQSFIERSITKTTASKFKMQPSLPHGNSTLAIASDGSFWPHGYSPYQSEELCFGKFPESSITEIWNNSPQMEKFRKWQFDILNICAPCSEYMKRCAGINFEMEIARQIKKILTNPFCVKNQEFPSFFNQE